MTDKQQTAITPKEKAAELINKMYYSQSSPTHWEQAKQCALIAVDEILNDDWYIATHEHLIERESYWKLVKQEIESL